MTYELINYHKKYILYLVNLRNSCITNAMEYCFSLLESFYSLK